MNATTPIGLPVAELDTPALLVDLDLLDRNIERIAGVVIDDAGINWRPHTKGLKTPALAHKLIARGALGVTCAKLGEAEVMATAGVKDILVANQVVGPAKTRRLAHLCRGGADVMVAVDSETGIRQIGEAATAAGSEVRVVVELNVGMDRAGVAPGEEAVRMARVAAGTPGVRLAGLMAWEGHTLGIEPIDAKRQAIEAAVGLLTDSADRCRAAGLPIDIVSCGGTGSYWDHRPPAGRDRDPGRRRRARRRHVPPAVRRRPRLRAAHRRHGHQPADLAAGHLRRRPQDHERGAHHATGAEHRGHGGEVLRRTWFADPGGAVGGTRRRRSAGVHRRLLGHHRLPARHHLRDARRRRGGGLAAPGSRQADVMRLPDRRMEMHPG